MRKLFVVMLAAALGLGAVTEARANSVAFQVLSGDPNALNVGDSVVISLLYTVDTPFVTSAVTFVDITGIQNAQVTRAITTNALSGASILTNFDILQNGAGVVATCVNSGGGGIRTCTGPPNGNGAGGFGGLSFTGFNQGTYSVGTLTITGTAVGDSNLLTRIAAGGEWQISGNDIDPQPSASLSLTVIPEPTTAALIGLGLVGLVAVGRRHRA
jgi:hypothetical protein